jgi:hypothetical protein
VTQGVTVLTGTAGGTLTIGPPPFTDVIVEMPATGGTVTLNVGTVDVRQRVEIDIVNGATLGTVVFEAGSTSAAGFIFSSTLPAYTPSAANETDTLICLAPGTTVGTTNVLRIQGMNPGFAF